MSSQQLLQEPGAKGESGLATLLQTEAVGTGGLRDSPQLYGHLEKVLENSETEDQDEEAMKQG